MFAAALRLGGAQAQAIEAWVQRYNGLGNGNDSSSAMAVDSSGNVYVTGWSYGGDPLYGGSDGDYTTIKYSSAGIPLWTNYYNGPGNRWDGAMGIVVDASGDVVVTGSAFSGSGVNYLSVKYSNDGIPLWTNRGPAGDAWAIAVDASGNVVVMGTSNNKCATVKYSSAGALLWTRTYNIFLPNALAVDAGGSVTVTGFSRDSLGAEDYLTFKYSSAGDLLWARTYNGPGNTSDRANAIAVDASGNVVVTGRSGGTRSSSFYGSIAEYATIKYSSTGVPLWTNRYDTLGNDHNSANAVALDPSGNVIVTGGDSSDHYSTIKYSSDGVPLWTNRYIEPGMPYGEAKALKVDTGGNVYVTGNSQGTDMIPHYATVAYSSAGVPLWTNRYHGPADGADWVKSIAVDAFGNVYVSGNSQASGGDSDYATVKYVIPPIITRQPVSCTNVVGAIASFTVEVAGSGPLGYQWHRGGTNLVDGGNISGPTTTNLAIANVRIEDALDYIVVVTNEWGSTTSTVAHLTVVVPPSAGRFTNFKYWGETGFSFVFRDATVGQPYRIQRSASAAAGSWADWQNFTYTEPIFLTDMGASGAERRFYRAVSP